MPVSEEARERWLEQLTDLIERLTARGLTVTYDHGGETISIRDTDSLDLVQEED